MHKNFLTFFRSLAFGLALVAQGVVCHADSFLWNSGTTTGAFSDAGNWTTTSDGKYASAERWILADTTITGVTALETTAVFDGAVITHNPEQLRIGADGTGTLTVQNNATLNAFNQVRVGYNAGSFGTLNINNSTALLYNGTDDQRMYVGYRGTGELNMLNSSFQSARFVTGYEGSGVGTATMENSTYTTTTLYLGESGMGTVTLNNGSSLVGLDGGRAAYIGYNAGSNGTLSLNSGSSMSGFSTLYVGYSGNGTLNAANSNIEGPEIRIADREGSTGTMSISSSTVTGTSLYVGHYGIAEMDITNGSDVVIASGGDPGAYIGSRASGNGVLNVSASSLWIKDANQSVQSMYVGSEGIGEINLTDNAVFRTRNLFLGGNADGSSVNATGTVNVTDSKIVLESQSGSGSVYDVHVGYNGENGTGTMSMKNSSLQTSNIYIGSQTATTSGVFTADHSDILLQNTVSGTYYNTIVGYKGSGELSLSNGSTLTGNEIRIADQEGSSGTVSISSSTVTGTNMYVGYYGSGKLSLSNGSTLTGNEIRVADREGSSGTVSISGGTVTGTNMFVGYYGNGTMEITNGSDVVVGNGDANNVYVGYRATGTGVLSISDSSMWIKDATSSVRPLYVGNEGTGEVNLASGTTFRARELFIGGNSDGTSVNATGTVNVTDSKIVLESQSGSGSVYDVHVGYNGENGTGTMSMKNSSLQSAVLYIGSQTATTSGVFTADNSDILLQNTVNGTYYNTFVGYQGSGELSLSNGSTLTGNEIRVADRAGSSGTVSISGSTVTGTNMFVGYYGDGTMEITNGSDVVVGNGDANNVYVGYRATGTGVLSISDSSLWIKDATSSVRPLYVGNEGTGEVNLASGTTLRARELFIGGNSDGTSVNATGTVNVTDSKIVLESQSGSGSVYDVHVGYNGENGTGTMSMKNSSLQSAVLYIGSQTATTSGVFTADNSDILLQNTVNGTYYNTFVGYQGSGELSLSNGSTLTGNEIRVADRAGSSGTVSISGSTVTGTNMFVGYYGDGTMEITNGSEVVVGNGDANNVYVGYRATGTGVLSISDSSMWIKDATSSVRPLYVGNEGTGEVNLTSGTTFRARELFIGGNSDGTSVNATGTVNVTDSKIVLESQSGSGSVYDVHVGYNGENGTGTMSMKNSSLQSAVLYIGSQTATTSGVFSADHSDILLQNTVNGTYYNTLVGYQGSGELSLSNGSTLTGNEFRIADRAGSSGTATVTDSAINGTKLHVGYHGLGTLTASNSDITLTDTGYVGYSADGVGSFVLNNNSTLTGTDLYVAEDGVGRMTIQNSTVDMNRMYVGHNNTGELTIIGGGSTITTDQFRQYVNGTTNFVIDQTGASTIEAGYFGTFEGTVAAELAAPMTFLTGTGFTLFNRDTDNGSTYNPTLAASEVFDIQTINSDSGNPKSIVATLKGTPIATIDMGMLGSFNAGSVSTGYITLTNVQNDLYQISFDVTGSDTNKALLLDWLNGQEVINGTGQTLLSNVNLDAFLADEDTIAIIARLDSDYTNLAFDLSPLNNLLGLAGTDALAVTKMSELNVPEPTSIILMILGLLAVTAVRGRLAKRNRN